MLFLLPNQQHQSTEGIRRIHPRHLRSKHESVTDEILERRSSIQCSRQHEQSIEPSAGLINALGNEITREAVLKLLLLLKRVVVLCVWHAAALEPAVEHFRHATQHGTRHRRRRNCQVIYAALIHTTEFHATFHEPVTFRVSGNCQ